MRRARLSWMQLLLVLGLAMVLVGCPEDDPDDPDEATDPVALVRQGWSAFEALDYDTANDRFSAAMSADGSMVDAFSGAGWTSYAVGDLSNARDHWDDGLQRDEQSFDIRAGLGFLEFQEENYAAAIARHSSLLEDNANYSFIHIPGLDFRDVTVTLAMSHYLLGQFEDAMGQVQALNAVFSADLATPEGISALAEEIERLYDLYRG